MIGLQCVDGAQVSRLEPVIFICFTHEHNHSRPQT